MLWNEKWNKVETEIFLSAADYMRNHGWCQGVAVDRDGRVCLIGAVSRAAGAYPGAYPDNMDKAYSRYREAVERLESYLGMSAAAWNDGYCQSEEQAIQKLIEAAYHDKM